MPIIQRICKECLSQCRCHYGAHGNIEAYKNHDFGICGFCGKDSKKIAGEQDRIMGALADSELGRRNMRLEASDEYAKANLTWFNAVTWECICDLRKCPSCGYSVENHTRKRDGRFHLIHESLETMHKCNGYLPEELPKPSKVRDSNLLKVVEEEKEVDWEMEEVKHYEDEIEVVDYKQIAGNQGD